MTFVALATMIIPFSASAETMSLNDKRIFVFDGQGYTLKLNGGEAASWKSKNEEIAMVNENGEVSFVNAGETTVTCIATDGSTYNCKVIASPIDLSKPMIAVTFDDGPGYNKASTMICDVLEKYDIKATYFMVGNNAKSKPKNVKRKVRLGCEIGNHTIAHKHYGKNVTASDIKKATKAIKEAGGVKPTAFRSPGGNTTSTIRKECKKEGMPLYYWSLDTQDWKYRNVDHVYNAVMKNVKDGDIILMHEIYETTAKAFKKMVPKLKKKGYQFVTCEELIWAKQGKAPKPGTQYVNGTTIRNNTR